MHVTERTDGPGQTQSEEDFMKVRAFLQLTRTGDALFAAFAVVIAGIISRDMLNMDYAIAFVVAMLITMATFAINDYYDYKNDKRNHRNDRPLVKGLMKRTSAFKIGIVLFVLALLASTLLNNLASLFIVINVPIFYLYSSHLKRHVLIKNLIVAYGFFAATIFGTLITDASIEPLLLYFAIMAFIVGLAFEIMIDIADVVGDRRSGVITLPVRFSKKAAANVSVFFYSVIIVLDPLPFFINIDSALHGDWLFLVLIMIPVLSYVFVSKALLRDQSKKNVIKLRSTVLKVMQIGTLAYLLGVIL